MALVPQISYRDAQQSDALDELVTDETAKLERFFPRIVSCRVLIERRRHRTGAPFQARITLSVPGEDIYINQAPDVHSSLLGDDKSDKPARIQKSTANVDAELKDPALAVRSAFKKARRRLQDYVRAREPASR